MPKIFRLFIAGAIILALSVLGSCAMVTSVAPGAGQAAVLISQPWLFGHGGVDPTPITTGRAWIVRSTHAVIVNMYPQEFHEEFTDLMSADGIPLNFDTHVRLQIQDPVQLISRFGENWYANNIQAMYRNFVRQAVRKHGMNETAISTVAIDAIDNEVGGRLRQFLSQAHIPVQLVTVAVGRANPPDAIKNQRVLTAQEQQRQITELQTQHAEEARLAAEQARANADNAYRLSMSLSPQEFIELQRINMMRDVCTPPTPQQGQQDQPPRNCTFISGTTAAPVITTR